MREFEFSQAVRERVPLFIGLVSPSGGGKTYSALRLATGIKRVVGGKIFGIDTEGKRMCHYADKFDFQHLSFDPPFSPLRYLSAVQTAVSAGAKVLIIDSASHLHEGIGGVLEMHEAELTRMAGDDYAKRERCKMAAWIRPKAELRKFLNAILQLQINIIFCLRAKEKIKMDRGGKPIPLGFMPIASEELIYEQTLSVLLHPNSGGVPSWHPEEMGEKSIIKLPSQFAGIFSTSQPLSEEIGEKLASWAAGGVSGQPRESMPAAQQAPPVNRQPAQEPKAPELATGAVADDYSHDTPPACATCQQPMRLNKAGVGKTKSSFWGCPNWKTCPGAKATISASKWRDELMDKQANPGADAFDFANDDAEEPPRQYPD